MEIPSLQLIVPDFYVGPNLQAAVNQAASSSRFVVWIPASYPGNDTYTNPANVPVFDMRSTGNLNFSPAPVIFPGAPSGPCSASQVAVNSGTGDLYSCSGGSWVKIGPTAGSLVSPISSPNPLVFDVNVGFKGKSPYTDVTTYGVRSTSSTVAPAIPGITATINSNSTSCTISAASSFQNGDGVTIFGAGPTITISTPGTPTVTPSNAAAGTGTGLVVNDPGTGGTSYQYQIVARDLNGGLTPAGTAGTTSTGQSSLGSNSVTVSGYTRSGQTVTATTSSAHGLTVGSMVILRNSDTSDAQYFGGEFVVASVPTNETFTFLTGNLDVNGAPTVSNGGGTAYWFFCNHLSWTPVTGAVIYYIYGRTSGSIALIGVSKIQNSGQSITDATWDDFGSPMMDGISVPYFVPSTPPASALNDPLTTTISSGAGTTNLTFAAPASNSVSGATILFDNSPNIAAAISGMGSSGLLYFPPGTYVINSYTSFSDVPAVSVGGLLVLNDTINLGAGSRWFGSRGPQSPPSPSFGWSTGNQITINKANPGLWFSSANGCSFEDLTVEGTSNAQYLVVCDGGGGGSQCRFQYVNFVDGGAGGTDYMGMPLLMRGGFWNAFEYVSFLTGPGQQGGGFVGSSATPSAFFNSVGSLQLSYVSLDSRGVFFIPDSAGGNAFVTGTNRFQGGITPFFTHYNTGGGVGINYCFSDVELDTMGNAVFANLMSNSGSVSGFVSINGGIGSAPAGGYGYFTGKPAPTVFGNSSGQNTAVISNSNFSDNIVAILGSGIIGYKMALPGAPTLVASSGGSVPTGTHTYQLAAYDVKGNFTGLGTAASITISSGTQTVTVSGPSVPPNGAVGYAVFRDGNFLANSAGQCASYKTIASVSGSFADTLASVCGSPYLGSGAPPSGASAAAIGSLGLQAYQLSMSGTLFANLGTPVNGTFVYCMDCTVANPCAGSGTGALAKRLNGAWVCN
jgi:hypothetical protein